MDGRFDEIRDEMTSVWVIMPPSASRATLETALWSLGYVPTVYSSEWAAIREVSCKGPRVVIIGDHYPYHGRTLLQLFRRCWGNEFLAIVVTDPATADSRLDLLAMGADNFLAAPLTAESASRQLEPLLQRKPTSLATA